MGDDEDRSKRPQLSERALQPIFSPRSIAVIGASRRRDSIGFSLLHNLVMSEFEGSIFPVNPSASSIHSLKTYPSIAAVPDPVDLAVVIVPRDAVQGVVEECGRAGVKGLVVITAGFAETGAEGAAAEEALEAAVRKAGMRMIGPNCMGVINADPAVSMNATFAPTPAGHGSIGFVSQSGALGVAILNAAQDLGIGFTQFASIGNKADVSGNDLVEYWEDDPETHVICMYLESFGAPRRFVELAKRVSRKKPILIVKSGRTEEGARAASSHTGALAGRDITVSTFLAQCGVLRAGTIDELFAVARALDLCKLPAGNRVAILTNAGGPAIMATDSIVNRGLEMAELGPETRKRLSSGLPKEASVANPVDMIASAAAPDYARSLEILLADPGVDMVLAINVTPLLGNPIDVMKEIGRVVDRGVDKPVLSVMMATEDFYDEVKHNPGLPPVYRFPEQAATALAQLDRYARWCRRPQEAPASYEVDDRAVGELLAGASDGYLATADAFRVLELYGIPVAPWRWVPLASEGSPTAQAVAAAAAEVGFPAVIKAEAPGLVHKSDLGAVRLGIKDAAEAARVTAEIEEALGEAGLEASGLLVQAMASPGHELLFGISTDPRFGPLLAFGLGGRYVEVFGDVSFGVPPLGKTEAADLLRSIRAFPLLEGVRGEPPSDLEILEEVLMRVGQLAHRHPRIVELDINPFLASPRRADAVAVDVRIRLETPAPQHEAI